MKIIMFSSWQVHCGIAEHTSQLIGALRQLGDTCVDVVPFDLRSHPRADYVRWGRQLNQGDVAHIQHEYTFFGYLLPWTNHFEACIAPIHKPLVITRHVSFDGPLLLPRHGLRSAIRQIKWAMYNKWLAPYATYLNKGTFDRAQQIIVMSVRLRDHLIARGVHPSKVHVIPAGFRLWRRPAAAQRCEPPGVGRAGISLASSVVSHRLRAHAGAGSIDPPARSLRASYCGGTAP